MNKISRFVIWICARFYREQIEEIIRQLQEILDNRNPEVKPKDDFKEKHPNYRDFYVDPKPPHTEPPVSKETTPQLDWRDLLHTYQKQNNRPLKPVKHRKNQKLPAKVVCPHCGAPAAYLYYNDGKKRSQIRCKVCGGLAQILKRFRPVKKAKYWCPYCGSAMYIWKQQELVTIHKCPNDHCPAYLGALNNLNPEEHKLRAQRSSQFKLRYQYREYHFNNEQLQHSKPDESKVDLAKIYNSSNILGLILTFHISFAIPARKTARIMKSVFNIKVSYQTVLNYAEAAAVYCHRFNLAYKGEIDDESSGDETYIKIAGEHAFTFLFISVYNHKITAYHLDHSRETLPATVAMTEAVRTAKPGQKITLYTDGNPSYIAGLHFINAQRKPENAIEHHKIIGLQNLDEESELYRHFKQIIERLNRTYRYHTRQANGFKSKNGAISYTTLFVTHYNFLRPHMALGYKVPIPLTELQAFDTIQQKWCRIIDMASRLMTRDDKLEQMQLFESTVAIISQHKKK